MKGELLLFVAATSIDPGPWPIDAYAFARVVDELRDTNTLAARFAVYTVLTGRWCQEFHDAVSLAHSACFLTYESPRYTRWFSCISSRAVSLWREKVGEAEWEQAVALMTAYREAAASSG